MSKFNPMVSIIIPVYNGSNYVREAINSALAQTYKNLDIIVVNDGSNDNGATERAVKEYGEKVRYIYKKNGGVSTALNVGIQNMKGEYFSWLSHDDVYSENKIEKSVEILGELKDKTTIIYCSSVHIDKNSKIISKNKNKSNIVSSYTWEEALAKLFSEGSMNGCAFLIHKSVFDKCGLFDEKLRFNQDGFMWSKIFLAKYSLVCIPDVCVKNRIHDKQLTQRGQDIFHSDCDKMSEYLIPKLLEIRDNNNLFIKYTLYNAKYNNGNIVKKCYQLAIEERLFGKKEIILIFIYLAYGSIRPFLRKVYYRIYRKMSTT